jgi:four helix bundle protein
VSESFKALSVWQRAVQLTIQIYKLTQSFPETERFGLTNQMRRAAVSVAGNIAEGYGRTSKGEYAQFLGHARGSNYEIATQITIARELGFGSEEALRRCEDLCLEVTRMLGAMIGGLRKKLEK